ncbi:MAG: hypothetical protein IK088_09370, partial [Lachnospiraceae bacterium]|nr:hypothetical protein [Lachnospiraceae bacterium]
MKKLLNGKMIIGLLLVLLLFIEGCTLSSNTSTDEGSEKEPTSQSTDVTNPSEGTEVEGYHEVKFALPAGMSEEAKEKTTLPVTTMIKDGSLIYSMKAPRQEGSVFLGWYYDDQLDLMVGPEDTVDYNMTLYPKFGLREDYEGEFSYDFIAEQDVSKKYPVLVTGHNLTAEEVKKFIRILDTGREGEVPFVVEPYGEEEEFKLEDLGLEEDQLENVRDMVSFKEGDPDYVLSEALNELGLDEETVDAILKEYAPDEWKQKSRSWMNDETKELMEAAGLSEEFSGVLDLAKQYGLEEGDSPARYWREELGFEPEEVLRMLEITEMLSEEAWNNTATYLIKPEDGAWIEGHSYDVEILDTASLRFFYNAEETIPKIIHHKFSVVKKEFNNIAMSNDIVYIPYVDVQGIDSLGGLYGLVMDNEGNTTETSKRGVLTYTKGKLAPGMTVAVYDGTLNPDKSVDGSVGYFKIAEDQGNGKYRYGGADLTDVVFLPDVIPLPDDGTFDDGKFVIPAAALNFNTPLHRELKLGADTTVDVGDFVVFYTGAASKSSDLKNGQFAKITGVEKAAAGTEITYIPSTMDELHDSADMYMKVEQLDIPADEIDEQQIEAELLRQVEESNFISATGDYITGLILGEAKLPDDPNMAQGLKELTFATDKGEELSLEELRRLAGGASKVEISKPTVAFTISLSLKHFHGKGVRAVVTAGFTIKIAMNGDNKLEIVVAAAIEQEIQLGLDISVDTEWDVITLEEIYVDVALKAGTFTGFGGQATVMTKEDNPSEEKEWNALVGETGKNLNKSDTNSLLNLGDTVGKMATAISAIQEGGTVSKSGTDPAVQQYTDKYDGPQISSAGGDLPAKYSEMLDNDAEYVDLVKFELFNLAASPDPFHLIEFSLSASVKIGFKVNAMIGFSLSYGNGREFGYHIKCIEGSAKQSNDYYEKPNFRVDFFVFGMLGLRAGIELDARVGLISTKFDSIGITAEVGLYAELYGFLYMYYTWEADAGSDKGIMGSLLFEIGIYLEINFKAQVGDGKYEKEIELYSNTWPLLQLGAVEVPVPYQEDSDEDDEALSAMLEIPKGKSTVKVPDAVFGIDMMALSSGDVERRSQDSKKVGNKNYDFVINGRTFTQYNEQHFDVTCYDLDGKDGKVTKNHSFQYLPATNEIYVKPVDSSKDELWGIVTFTYRNESFGFSTMEIKRTLKVHWKGDPCSATVEYYLQGENGYEMVKEGSFDGFDGIEYDIQVDDAFVYQFPGYRLAEVEFPDSDKQWDVVQKAYNEMLKLYDIYQEKWTDSSHDKWWASHQHWNTLWNKANMYDWNIEQTIKNKKGTLYFLMVKNVTVVRLYFNSTKRYVSADLLYEDMPNTVRTNVGTYMTMGDNMYDKLMTGVDFFLEENPAYQIKSDYYVYFTDERFMTVSEVMKKKDEWQVLKKDTIMPDKNAFIFAYINSDRPFTLTWIDRGEIIRQDQLIRWQDIPAPPETKPYPGYTHSYYSWIKDNGDNLVTNARMEDRDVTYTVKWTPQLQTITWNVDGETWKTTAKTDDLVVAQWPGTYRGSDWKRWGNTLEKEGYTLTWKVRIGDEEGDFNPAMKTPAGGATLIAVYTLNSYKVTWKDGDTVVKEETLDFGSTLQAPEVTVPEGTGLAWQLDGKDLPANASLPGRDITISTSRHTHDWKEDYVLQTMNCNTEGLIRFKCTICGETKNETVAIDPEQHNWNRTSFSLAYCMSPQIDHYTCSNCGQKKDVEVGEKNPSRHISGSWTLPGVAATCGAEGRYTATYCNDCDALLSGGGVIPATGNHSWSAVANPDATCTETGTMHFTCNVCNATKEETIPAKGHSWRNPTYSWSDDHLTATASRTCNNDPSHVETETVSTTNEVIYEATCTSVGQRNYYAVFTNTAFREQSYGEVIPKIPHIWNAPVYTWADDLSTVTAKRVCQYDPNEHHVETETATVKSAVTTAPGCETTGIRTYTANFSNTAFATQVKDVVVPAAGHTWGEPTYSWSDNNAFVTATRVCTVDANHTESETVETTASFTISPQCETPGSLMYTAAFTNQAFQTQTKTVSASPTGHSWGEPVYVWATDYSTVTAERVCQNDGSHKETEIAVTSSEITKAPTYDEMGETTYTVTFTNTAFGVQTQTVTNVPKTPEEYNAPTYAWAADYSSVTASRVRKDGKKTESETVSATGEVTTPATCLAMGKTTYTSAAFTNPAFEVQTKVVENIAALGHQWGAITYTWADDYSTVTAGRVCAHDASHVETETAITSSAVTKPATFDEMGETTYTATFTNTAFATQTRTVANIEKVPEGWNAPTYEWALDYSTVTATRVRTDGLKTETETVAASGEVTMPATCESKGITTYTSQSFANTAFTVQTKVVDNIPALNHNWVGVSYVWADDY